MWRCRRSLSTINAFQRRANFWLGLSIQVCSVILINCCLPFIGRQHSRTQSPSYARSTERDEGLWPNPYQTGIWLATTKVIVLITYISFTMFLWFPVLDLARAPRRTARKQGSGYENEGGSTLIHSRTQSPSYARCDEGLWPNPKPDTIKTW